jgi:choline/glycine/proline betaine transport protein
VEGLSAALLLLAGGLGALQAATLVAALPFTIIMILLAFGLVRQMNADRSGIPVEQAAAPLREPPGSSSAPKMRRRSPPVACRSEASGLRPPPGFVR